jgi:hypothetical protein
MESHSFFSKRAAPVLKKGGYAALAALASLPPDRSERSERGVAASAAGRRMESHWDRLPIHLQEHIVERAEELRAIDAEHDVAFGAFFAGCRTELVTCKHGRTWIEEGFADDEELTWPPLTSIRNLCGRCYFYYDMADVCDDALRYRSYAQRSFETRLKKTGRLDYFFIRPWEQFALQRRMR